jgi:hypothetical protein
MGIKRGSLIRWVSSHRVYESDGKGLVGVDPIYNYGIVIETSKKDPSYLIIARLKDAGWYLLDIYLDDFEIISEGA